MGTTKNAQKQARAELDDKLALAQPTRQILEDLAIACAKSPSPDNTFQYAFCLSKSTEPSELRYAVTILDGLVKEGYEHQVDCLYGAACALYLLGDYDKARVSCLRPSNDIFFVGKRSLNIHSTYQHSSTCFFFETASNGKHSEISSGK